MFAVSLRALARGVSRVAAALAGGDDAHAATLGRAILANPWAIDGPGRANTIVTERLGVIAKLGAEGVLVLGTPVGTAVALKVLDGSMRAITAICVELLVSVGALEREAADDVIAATTDAVLGGGAPVGELAAASVVTDWRLP